MKAVGKAKSVNGKHEVVKNEATGDYMDDGIIIVAFPSQTWHTVELIAENMGISTSEVLSKAIERFEQEME